MTGSLGSESESEHVIISIRVTYMHPPDVNVYRRVGGNEVFQVSSLVLLAQKFNPAHHFCFLWGEALSMYPVLASTLAHISYIYTTAKVPTCFHTLSI